MFLVEEILVNFVIILKKGMYYERSDVMRPEKNANIFSKKFIRKYFKYNPIQRYVF